MPCEHRSSHFMAFGHQAVCTLEPCRFQSCQFEFGRDSGLTNLTVSFEVDERIGTQHCMAKLLRIFEQLTHEYLSQHSLFEVKEKIKI